MIVQPRIFDGSPGNGDVEYFEWRAAHPDGFIANVPNPNDDRFSHIPIVIHCARCYTLGLENLKGESATEETQWKVCDVSQGIVESYLEQEFPERMINRCRSIGRNGCEEYWNSPMP